MNEKQRLQQMKLRTVEEGSATKRRERERKAQVANAQRGSYAELLQQAGIQVSSALYVFFVLLGAIVSAVALIQTLGMLVGLFTAPVLGYFFLYPFLVGRAEKRRQRVVPHLPAFIDTLEASLQTGYNMDLAVEHAAQALPEGILKHEFAQVVQNVQAGVSLDEGLDHLLRRISGQEVVALVITIRLFSGMGGRVLEPLQRLGKKVREQQGVLERATRDLVLTKNAFYFILALSVMVPIFSFMRDPEYLQAAFQHPTLKYVLQVAMIIEVICVMSFKRLTTMRV